MTDFDEFWAGRCRMIKGKLSLIHRKICQRSMSQIMVTKVKKKTVKVTVFKLLPQLLKKLFPDFDELRQECAEF